MTAVVYPYQILFILVSASSPMAQKAPRNSRSGSLAKAFDPRVLELVLKVKL